MSQLQLEIQIKACDARVEYRKLYFSTLQNFASQSRKWETGFTVKCEFLKDVFSSEHFICPAGETIKIVIEDYVQHLSGYHFKLKFDPELLFNQRFQYQNRIASEFNTLYHWHPLMPDSFHIEEKEYSYKQFVFNNSVVTEHGINNLVESFSKQIAGQVRTVDAVVAEISLRVLRWGWVTNFSFTVIGCRWSKCPRGDDACGHQVHRE